MTKGGGRWSGRGAFDWCGTGGVGMNVAIEAQTGQLSDRDDIQARVTGPITMHSDGSGGTIAGDVELVSGSFKLGSATASAQVPRLDVTEVNRPADEALPPEPELPWRLDVDVRADNRLTVPELGRAQV